MYVRVRLNISEMRKIGGKRGGKKLKASEAKNTQHE